MAVSIRIQSECGNMRTRITPNTDTFYAVQKLGFSIFHGELIKVNYNEKSADIICYVLASLVFW